MMMVIMMMMMMKMMNCFCGMVDRRKAFSFIVRDPHHREPPTRHEVRFSQGLILGPLLFNVNLIDLFLAEHYKSDFSNCTDDTTPYDCGSAFFETIPDLEITLDKLFNWSCYNNFKANTSKCHLFLSPFNAKSINMKSSAIEGSSSEKFLGITIESALLLKNI